MTPVSRVRASGERALTASLGGEFEAIFVRAQDIPEFVADGAADAGVTGWDLVCESERPLDSPTRPRLREVSPRGGGA
jgi:ATP phosphoribosyltransferase